jgi:hypothetical protein
VTDEDIIRRLANERGWELLPENRIRFKWNDGSESISAPWCPLSNEGEANECLQELIAKTRRQFAFTAYLKYVAGDNGFDLITATPRQICEAIVMTLNATTEVKP